MKLLLSTWNSITGLTRKFHSEPKTDASVTERMKRRRRLPWKSRKIVERVKYRNHCTDGEDQVFFAAAGAAVGDHFQELGGNRWVETDRVRLRVAVEGWASRESARAERAEEGEGWRLRCGGRGKRGRVVRGENTGHVEEGDVTRTAEMGKERRRGCH